MVFILALMILPACGGFSLFKDSKLNGRKTASIEINPEASSFQSDLKILHSYHLLALKNKHSNDDCKLIVIKSKILEIETNLMKKNSRSLKNAVSEFASGSDVAFDSMKNLATKLGLNNPHKEDQVSEKSLSEALKLAEDTKEFQILSMNIEHLSHMMNLKLKNTGPRKTSLDWMAQHPDKIIKRTKKLI